MTYKVLNKQNNSSMCFVCGVNNPFGLKARFYECENEAGETVLLTVLTPREEHQSYPNRMHGGVVSALLDEGIGRAEQIENPDIWGVTIDLNVKFRKPTPLDQTLYIESKIVSRTSRTFDGEGKLFIADGTVCATATGKYFICPVEKIADGGMDEDNWFSVEENLPEQIVI